MRIQISDLQAIKIWDSSLFIMTFSPYIKTEIGMNTHLGRIQIADINPMFL
jgi:hypothetical protein